MMTASLAPLRMADLQHLAIPGQKKVPRKDLRFSRFEHSSPAPQPGRQQQLAPQGAAVRTSPPLRGPAQRLYAPRRHVPDIQLATQGRPFCH